MPRWPAVFFTWAALGGEVTLLAVARAFGLAILVITGGACRPSSTAPTEHASVPVEKKQPDTPRGGRPEPMTQNRAVPPPEAPSASDSVAHGRAQPQNRQTERAGDRPALAGDGLPRGKVDAVDLRPVQPPRPPQLDENRLRHAGIRRWAGKHLTLYTDQTSAVPLDHFPTAFDQAVPQWCQYFGIPPHQAASWHLTGYLIVDKRPFRALGLLPDDLPPFLHGYQRGHELWMYDQPSDYYRLHLLLHEGTHGFAHRFLGGVGPAWYAEGIAELLATHRWQDGQLTLGYFPANKEEVPFWGRIKIIQQEVAARRGLSIRHIMQPNMWTQLGNETYAWCWALAAMLDNHPRYQQHFRQLARHLRGPERDVTALFEQQWKDQRRELDEEWQLLVVNMIYGYDVPREAVQYKPGRPLRPDGDQVAIAADHAWQSSGFWLQADTPYRVTAAGRYQIARTPDIWWCEPGGVTIRYWGGHPLGKLLGAVRPDQATAGLTPLARPFAIGLGRTIRPEHSGTLYLRINDSPAETFDNAGELMVQVVAE